MYVEAALKFIFGIVILLSSSVVFIEEGKKLSGYLKISNLIIGITLIAIGTSLPELAVSVAAVIRGDVGLAVANIVGSNISNILLIFPIGVLIGHLRVGTEKTQRNLIILFIATLAFILLIYAPLPSSLKALILILGAVAVTITEYLWGIAGRTLEDRIRFVRQKNKPLTYFDIFLIIVSATGIAYGGVATATASEEIALFSGYSTTVIGLTLTAISTSLPELFMTVIGQKGNEEKLTLGNIIGSNIYNLLLIGGIIVLLSPNLVSLNYIELIFLPLATVFFIAAAHAYKGKTIPRKVSFLFFVLFVLYVKLLAIG